MLPQTKQVYLFSMCRLYSRYSKFASMLSNICKNVIVTIYNLNIHETFNTWLVSISKHFRWDRGSYLRQFGGSTKGSYYIKLLEDEICSGIFVKVLFHFWWTKGHYIKTWTSLKILTMIVPMPRSLLLWERTLVYYLPLVSPSTKSLQMFWEIWKRIVKSVYQYTLPNVVDSNHTFLMYSILLFI